MADSPASLQVATLVVEALTPIAVAGLGIFLARASRRLEQVQWMYANRVLFSEPLFDAYRHFMATLFATWTTVGADALLRAPITSKWGDRRDLRWWNDAMPRLFSTDPADNEAIQMAYDQLSERFRADLYVTRQNQPLLTGPA